MRVEELKKIIETSTGESEAQKYFEKYPEVLRETLPYPHSRVVPQFQMGGEFIPDFVLTEGFSGGFRILLIELEPPSCRIFNNDGTPAKRYNGAMKQVEEWRRFVELNRDYFLRRLSKAIKKRDLCYTIPGKGEEPTDSTGRYKLTNTEVSIHLNYAIIISKRELLTSEDLLRKSSYMADRFETITYDRFIPTAQRCDKYRHVYEKD